MQPIKTFIRNLIVKVIKKVTALSRQERASQIQQIQITNQYRLMKKNLMPSEMPSFRDIGFSVCSEFEEDGILLYIFSIIGTTNKKVVEICAGNGIECMAANLIINHDWHGLLFDGNEKLVKQGINFFASFPSTRVRPPVYKQAWLTLENINGLIADNDFSGTIDLLSLDIDGNDYYMMDTITAVIRPRVIICETQNVIPGDLALTIPYKADFDKKKSLHPDFMSVSLLAMKKLLNKKGYRLIGSNRLGFNAIFMLDELGTEYFPEVSVDSINDNPYTKYRNATTWNEIKDLPWVVV